jgi:hypothetical protein
MFSNPFSIIFTPNKYWRGFANHSQPQYFSILPYLLLMTLIPSACWYYGTTVIGWQIHGSDGDVIKLTTDSALKIAAALYFALLFSIATLGYATHWMAKTYGAESSVMKGIALTSLTSTPFFIASISGLYPVLWFDLVVGIIAICWSTYLLYSGIPVAMNIPKNQGFMYSSALLTVAFVIFIVLLGATAILWGNGITPVFSD